MDLWIIRHATAVEPGEFAGSDAERPLTPKGRDRFRKLAGWLADSDSLPEFLVSSPLVRAVQTADVAAEAWNLGDRQRLQDSLLSPGVDVARLLRWLRERDESTVAVVGHEPDMSRLTSLCIAGGSLQFSKGAVACVTFDSPAEIGLGMLRWFVHPKLGDW